MADLSDFFAMGGYAAYVWPSFAVAFAAIGAVILGSAIELGRVRRETFRRALVPRRHRGDAAEARPATDPRSDEPTAARAAFAPPADGGHESGSADAGGAGRERP